VHDGLDMLAQQLLLLVSQQAEFQVVALFICQGAPKCGTLLSSAKRAHTHTHTHTHATGLPKERRPGRCICMCRSGKNYHRSVQRLLSSLCMSAAATDLSSICLFCSAVCLNQHACPLIDSLTQHHPHHHTRNCLAHISHHHPISISITTSRPACPRTYTSTSTSTSTSTYS
jgi:hypothetical protein